MTFGDALQALKNGQKVARAGWNGKGMFLTLNPGSAPAARINADSAEDLLEGIGVRLFEPAGSGTVLRLPNIDMRTATGSTCRGWLASQTDMLAEDWEVV